MRLGELSQEVLDIFGIEQSVLKRPFEFVGSTTHIALSYERNINLQVTEREVGRYFDFLSAAGGLSKGLRLLFRVVVSFFSYNVYSVYMVSHLFKRPPKTERRMTIKALKVERAMKEKEHSFNPKKVSSLKMLFFAAIPNKWKDRLNENRFKCLKRGKNYRQFEQGIKEYE